MNQEQSGIPLEALAKFEKDKLQAQINSIFNQCVFGSIDESAKVIAILPESLKMSAEQVNTGRETALREIPLSHLKHHIIVNVDYIFKAYTEAREDGFLHLLDDYNVLLDQVWETVKKTEDFLAPYQALSGSKTEFLSFAVWKMWHKRATKSKFKSAFK